MKGLRLFFCTAMLLTSALSAHGQALRQPELLARYQKLIAEFDRPGFEEFESDYLAELGPEGDLCLFGCSSGFSGNGPNIAGDGYREFLIHADLVTLARTLQFPLAALDHLERATNLLQLHWESCLVQEARAASDGGMDHDFHELAWRDFAGSVAQITPPILPAMALRSEVEQLRYRGSLSTEDRQRLLLIDHALREMTAEND
jgi:hypothetical protein